MNDAGTGSDVSSPEVPDRLQAALNSARAASMGSFILLLWALTGLVFTFAEIRIDGSFDAGSGVALWNLALVNFLADGDTEISRQIGAWIATAIVAELCLLLFLLYRMRRGGFISALLFLLLFLIEAAAKLPLLSNLGELQKFGFAGMALGIAVFICAGVFAAWQFRKLSREPGSASART